MTRFQELDVLSTTELHHQAINAAEHRHDVKFFWELLEYLPMAEVIAGSDTKDSHDVKSLSKGFHDFAHRGGKLDEALRPIYIEYLEHPRAADDETAR